MTIRAGTQVQQVAGGTIRTVYGRGPREVWTDMPHRGWFITMTLLGGEVLMEDGEIKLGPDYGRFVKSGPPVAPLGGRTG